MAAFVFSEIKKQTWKNIFTWVYLQENASDSVLFSTVAGLRAYSLKNRDSILDVLRNLWSFTESQFYDSWATTSDLQDFGHITCSISNKSTQSQLTVCLGPPQGTIRKQFTVFVSKIFKIAKVEGHIFCGWGRRNELKRVFSRSSHRYVFCKKSVLKYWVKLTQKHLCRSLSLACWRETLLKERLLHRCFPIKFIRAKLFQRTPVNSLTTLTTKFNFEEIIEILVHEAIWKRI